jgi:hypothetical protein
VPEIGRGDERAESNPIGGYCRGCERRDRAEPGKISMPAPGEVVVGPGVREAEFLRDAGILDSHHRRVPARASRSDADWGHLGDAALAAARHQGRRVAAFTAALTDAEIPQMAEVG